MNTLTIILTTLIALLGYPTGVLIARFTEDELERGRRWFLTLIAACIAGIILSLLLFSEETLVFFLASFTFVLLLALASLIEAVKSKRKTK